MPKLLDRLDLPSLDGARCMDSDPELWFEASDGAPPPEKLAELRAICGGCPTRQRCLDYALQRDMHGFWGGMTQAERAPLLPPKSGPVCRECGAGFARPAGTPTLYCSDGCRLAAKRRLAREACRRYKRTKGAASDNRRPTCPEGHAWEPATTDYTIAGHRRCKTCKGAA